MTPFDPYHKWLGIPPDQQPAGPHRLLGISEDENDPQVVREAALRQTAFVRKFSIGEHGEHAERILSELADARDSILSGKVESPTKSAVKPTPSPVETIATPLVNVTAAAERETPQAEPTPREDPLAFMTEQLAADSSKPSARSRSRSGKPIWKEPWAISVGTVGIVMVLLLVIVFFGSGDTYISSPTTKSLPARLQQGLVAYYPFNGNANDESGNGNHGTVQGANLAPDRYGAARSAYHFLRSADAIYAKAGTNLYPHSKNIVTYTLWFNLNSLIEPHFLSVCPSRNTQDGPDRFFVAATDRNFTMTNGGSKLPLFTTAQFPLHTWQHMAVEYNYLNATAKAWHNGTLLGKTLLTVLPEPPLPQSLRIGSLGGDPKNPDLLIDDVRIYNRALSEAEVKSLYEFEKP